MNLLSKLSQARDNIVQGVFHAAGHDSAYYCQIETVFDDHTFVLTNGGLLSILEVDGMRAMPGEDESARVVRSIQKNIAESFRSAAHSITFVFDRDPSGVRDDIQEMYQPTYATASRLRMSINDVLDGDVDQLASYTSSERCFIVVATHPRTLAKADYKNALKERNETMAKARLPLINHAQNPLKVLPQLANTHASLIDALAPTDGEILLRVNRLNITEMSHLIRWTIDSEFTAPEWMPDLPGGNPPIKDTLDTNRPYGGTMPFAKVAPSPFDDASHLMPCLLGYQFVPRNIEVGERMDTVRIGSRYFAPLVLERGPQRPEEFLSLFRKVGIAIPWRVCFTITPDGLLSKKFAQIYTSILGFMGENNRRLRASLKGLEALKADGESIVGFQCNAITWANDEKTLAKNVSDFSRAFQSWGVCDLTNSVGDPVPSFFSTIPGFTSKNPAVTMAAPLSDITNMMPLTRPASPWKRGAIVYRTPDGKLYPVQPVSSMQDMWNLLIYAPPGSGKSVTMNSENFAFCLSPGMTNLPLAVVLDIGPSSSGLTSMLKDALPEDQQHLVGYFKLRNNRECAINIFSTQLGCRKPTPRERSMQVNFLSLLATPVGDRKPYNMAPELAGVVVDEIYETYSDKKRPKLYESHMEPIVDKALDRIGYAVSPATTWWQIVDALFDKGFIHEAARAQDYALPTLADITGALGSQSVNDMFNRDDGSVVQAGNGQRLVDAMSTIISSSLREYPVLNGVTQFDVGSARVISLDLNEVAQGDDPASKRRSAIMYFLGYSYVARRFFIDDDILQICGERYKQYHKGQIAEIKEEPKAIIMDEFHKTGGLDALRSEVITNQREGRKWAIRVVLASQLLEDFSEEMIKLSSALYIMKAPNQADVDKAQHLFNLSDVAARRISNELTGPTPAGAPFLAIYNTKKGRYSQILINTIGATKRWALSTTAEDMSLRNRLYDILGGREARALLTQWFPTGTAVMEIERRKRMLDENAKEGVVEALSREMMKEYYAVKAVLSPNPGTSERRHA